MRFFIGINGFRDEILGSIDEAMDFVGEDGILHNIIWHAFNGCLCQSSSANHVE